jgi:hypothetical protein
MNGQRTAALVASAVLAATVLATSAVAGSPKVSQADRAMGERYQAMAQSWAQATGALSSSPQAQQALAERYQAMARYYVQTGRTERALAAYYGRAELEQARREAAAFDWLDAGIGALAAMGALSLLGLGALGLHAHSHRRMRPAVS